MKMGAWSMACVLQQQIEYCYYYKNYKHDIFVVMIAYIFVVVMY